MNVLVDRKNKQVILKGLKKMMRVIEEGHPLVIFPEGTISKIAPKTIKFKSGAVSLALIKQIPILPITFTSNWKILQRKGFFNGKAGVGISKVIIHPLIATLGKSKNDTDLLLLELESIINTPLLKS